MTVVDQASLMAGFCSIGCNCELGLAQRHAGAEPLDLLRWAHVTERTLLAMLEDRFARIGTALAIDTNPHEHMVANAAYGFCWHSFARPDRTSAEDVLAREIIRLPRLAEKLMDELSGSRRVFLRRSSGLEDPRRLLAAMEVYGGGPTLAYVTEGAFAVEARWSTAGYVRGFMPRFGDADDLTATTPMDDWLHLCGDIAELVHL